MAPKRKKGKRLETDQEQADKEDPKRKKWTEVEKTKIAEYILDAHKDGKYDRKDLKTFIDKMRVKLGFECNYKQIRNCYEKLEIKYKFVNDWLEKTGSGLQESDPASIEAFIKKHCPQFRTLENVWATRNDINPPVVYDSGQIAVHLGDSQFISSPNFQEVLIEDTNEIELGTDSGQDDLSFFADLNQPETSTNILAPSESEETTTPVTHEQSAASFRRSLTKTTGHKRRNIDSSLNDLDNFMTKKVEVEEKRLRQDKEHKDMQLSIKESKLQFRRSQFEDKERNRLMMKIMDMQERRDLELLKLGKEPDLSYSQRMMEIYGISQTALPSTSASSSSMSSMSSSAGTEFSEMSSDVHGSSSNK